MNQGNGKGNSNNGQSAAVQKSSAPKRINPCDLLKNLKSADKSNLKKPTILEQAKQDWNKCKAEEDIEEELKQATKSKSGYIEKQRFLERSDLRQFEREREIRDRTRARAALNKDQ